MILFTRYLIYYRKNSSPNPTDPTNQIKAFTMNAMTEASELNYPEMFILPLKFNSDPTVQPICTFNLIAGAKTKVFSIHYLYFKSLVQIFFKCFAELVKNYL